ncbi:MAG: DUF1549 and DUF1553 domain-containing protein [Gemmataceae bacterium]|nr:DUF1549 and DUF1553 domain-containing protein [Gemmataceae bacterium]
MPLRPALAAVALAVVASAASADQPVEQVIDREIDAALAAAGVEPAPPADDATLIRRLTLDLVGRIPTLGEVERYVGSADPGKRAELVDRLLASHGYARHQAAQFEAMFNPDGDRRGGNLREYLVGAVADNRGWDRVFRDLLLPDHAEPPVKGAADFLRPRAADADRLTNDVGVAFFGVNVSCAQCHDHPHVKDWTQAHFYGMKAFLARTYEAGGVVAERGYGVVKYKPTKGPERAAKPMFLAGGPLDDPSAREATKDEEKAEKAAAEEAKKTKTAPPRPTVSARAKLVEVALQDGNADYLARSIVNRLWHRFFGLGLVTPLDQMHAENPPSHPELLAWLARDTAAHGYDLKRLVRGLVLSEAYSRSSRYGTEAAPDPRLFAVARLKPLTPMQLAASLKVAGTDPAEWEKGKPEEFEKRIEQAEGAARGFAGLLAQPNDNFQVGVGEALLFSNGERVTKEFLTDGGGSLLGRVNGAEDPAKAVELLVKVAYGRPPTDAERRALVEYVEARKDRPAEAYRQVLWALVTGPEFRFNY